MIIAIDGPSGTGKSTVARAVARRLGFTFFDTGAMYRSFAWYIWHSGIDPMNEDKVVEQLSLFHFSMQSGKGDERSYFVNGVDVTDKIRSREIAIHASLVAGYPRVRKAMVKMQRKFGKSCDAVFEGRDMGTVVFPKADLKIFLTAEERVRAERRHQELLVKSPGLESSLSLEQILQEMQKRDINDSTRSASPLKQAEDAILIDTSQLSINEVVDQIVRLKSEISTSMRFVYGFVWWVARIIFKVFFRLRVYGQKHVHAGAGIMIANHSSFFDPPVLAVSYLGEVHFLARESLFRSPFLGRLIRSLNTHPVANDAGDLHVLRQMISLLQSGKKLILFPEGQRSLDGDLHSFARGFAFLAKKTKCTIFPVYLDGVYQVWPASRSFPRLFGKITCVFGSPIEAKEFEGALKEEEMIMERCSQAILSLKSWLEKGAQGEPP